MNYSKLAAETSGADEASDCCRCLGDLFLRVVAAGVNRIGHAVLQVVVKQPQRNGLECLRDCRHLGENVDAIRVLIDHPLQAPYLALDAPQPRLHDVLLVCVSRHADHCTPEGYPSEVVLGVILYAVADQTIIGKIGRVTGTIAPGRIGEVMIPVRGGSEAFHAYAVDTDEEIARGQRVVVVEHYPPRTVVVTKM